MFHLHVRYTSKDSLASCTEPVIYGARMGKYAKRPDKVRFTLFIHMPSFADSEATFVDYWIAAEGPTSRQNARTSVVLEASIPKSLSNSDQNELVRAFASVASLRSADVPGHAVPLVVSLHEGFGRNPHFHMSLSTSTNDWVIRPVDRWFRRFDPNHPERGGARRSRIIENKRWLLMIRRLWAKMANLALLNAGQEASLDDRSNYARGISLKPSIHLGPAIEHVARKGGVTLRSARLDEIRVENESQVSLEATAAEGRLVLGALRLRMAQWEVRLRRWHAARRDRWQRLLAEHPLLERSQLRTVAAATVVDLSAANWNQIGFAHGQHTATSFESALDSGWESVRVDDGLWQIDPDTGDAVLIHQNYICTDGASAKAFEIMVSAAMVLAYEKPVVYTQPEALSTFREVLDRLGLNWVTKLVGPTLRRAGSPNKHGR